MLTKILKDGSVNRQTVSETMINLGPMGEQTILTILKEDQQTNLKFKDCLVRSLALSQINSPNIDFVVENLFETAGDPNPNVRKSSLISLDILHMKSRVDDIVTYLKPKNLLPFFYKALIDPNKQVRKCALLCI